MLIVGGLYLGYVYQFDDTVRATLTDWGTRYASGDYAAALGVLQNGAEQLNTQISGVTGVGGLALGYSVTFLIELSLLLVILRRRWGDIDARQLGQTTLRTVAATVVMSAAVLAADAVFGVMGWHEAGVILSTLRIFGLAGVGAVTFVIAGMMFGLREIRTLPAMIFRRRSAALQDI